MKNSQSVNNFFRKKYHYYFLLEESEVHFKFGLQKVLFQLLEINQSKSVFFEKYIFGEIDEISVAELFSKDNKWIYEEYEELQFLKIEDDKEDWSVYTNGTHDMVIMACDAHLYDLFINLFSYCDNLNPHERLEILKSTFLNEMSFYKTMSILKEECLCIRNGLYHNLILG